MSYSAWQRLLRKTLSNLKGKGSGYPCRKQKKKNKNSRRYRNFLRMKARFKNEIVDRQIASIIEQLESFKCSTQTPITPTVSEDKGSDIHLLVKIT